MPDDSIGAGAPDGPEQPDKPQPEEAQPMAISASATINAQLQVGLRWMRLGREACLGRA